MRIFSTSSPNELQFFSCGNLRSADGFVHQRRVLNCCVLIYVMEGELHIGNAYAEHTVRRGEYILLNAGEEHFGTAPSQGQLSYLWAHFGFGEPFSSLYDEDPDDDRYIIPEHSAARTERISALFRQLCDISRRGNLLYTQKMPLCAMDLLLMEITQEYIERIFGREYSPAVAAMCGYIRSECCKDITTAELAEKFHYNAEYLAALFKRETGVTVSKYLNRSRIELSKRLLSSGNVSIKETAFSCGFSDEKYYMRLFRQYEGMTPLEYKRSVTAFS